jgi:hypothetical protein
MDSDDYYDSEIDGYKKGGRIRRKKKIIRIIRRKKAPKMPKAPKMRARRMGRAPPLPRQKALGIRQTGKAGEVEVPLSMPRQSGAYRYVAPGAGIITPYSAIDQDIINRQRLAIEAPKKEEPKPEDGAVIVRQAGIPPPPKQEEHKQPPVDDIIYESKLYKDFGDLQKQVMEQQKQIDQMQVIVKNKQQQVTTDIDSIYEQLDKLDDDLKKSIEEGDKAKEMAIKQHQNDLLAIARDKKAELKKLKDEERKARLDKQFTPEAIKEMFKGMESMNAGIEEDSPKIQQPLKKAKKVEPETPIKPPVPIPVPEKLKASPQIKGVRTRLINSIELIKKTKPLDKKKLAEQEQKLKEIDLKFDF